MSDQVSGPVGWTFILMGILYGPITGIVLPFMQTGELDSRLAIFSTGVAIAFFYIGGFFLTHDYWWWPNHAQDRVARIRELFDEPDCQNPPGGKT